MSTIKPSLATLLMLLGSCFQTLAQNPSATATAAVGQSVPARNCPVTYDRLKQTLRQSVKPSGGPSNGGLDNNEWAVVVGRDGSVCAVAFSGASPTDEWLGSRAIAAEKANTANSFSLKNKALSTANLYAGAQPGGFLFGIPVTDPLDSGAIAAGESTQYGTESDPIIGKRVGGVIVFGGGLPLYSDNDLIGGLGISGDTSCADHNVAWRVRHAVDLDHVPAGVNPNNNDGIIYDFGITGSSKSGFGHPTCGGNESDVAGQIGAGVVHRGLP